jgi:hypothetical protein
MSRDVEVQNTPPSMIDDEKAVEHTECESWDGEEVHGSDSFSVVTQKGRPAPGWLGISGSPTHPTGDGSLGDIETEHQ